MAKFTKERKAIRTRRDELYNERAKLEKNLLDNARSIRKLHEEECGHPALERGNCMGMSYSDCPDCGYSHP